LLHQEAQGRLRMSGSALPTHEACRQATRCSSMRLSRSTSTAGVMVLTGRVPWTTLDRRRVPKEQRERRSKVTPHMETIARDVRHAEDGANRSLPSPIPSVRGQRSARIPPGSHWRR
jgi:hypothetical protein